jgi:hypothetical protein
LGARCGWVRTTIIRILTDIPQIAIELGLHSSSSYTTQQERGEAEVGRRTFWTAYVLEITLAYNLGRPFSIGEEHITAVLPDHSTMGKTSTLHIKHRRIQHRLISKVYGANRDATGIEAQTELALLQNELDDWRTEPSTLSDDAFARYPRE